MSYDIEVRQSRFPNALDPTLTGFFPKYHGWEAFWLLWTIWKPMRTPISQ